MSDNRTPANVPPFPPEYRASGWLLHVTSLPSPHGIGFRSEVVAGAAARSDGVREFTLSTDVVVCRKCHAD